MYDIDVHVIKPNDSLPKTVRWFDQCVASLDGQPINIHFVDYVPNDIRAARFTGFSKGTAKYVSFVDPDDWVEPGIFSICAKSLDLAPHACGAFTLSNMIEVDQFDNDRNAGLLYPYRPWPLPERGKLIDIHQLVVMRRELIIRAITTQYDIMPKNVHEMTWLYWEMAKSHPWLPINAVGYNWRRRIDGAHRRVSPDIIEDMRMSNQHMNDIRRSIITQAR